MSRPHPIVPQKRPTHRVKRSTSLRGRPLGDVARNASAEIYLNGERLADTWPLPPDRLVPALPDAQRMRPPLEVTAAWLGNEARTTSRRPLVLTEEQLRPFH